MVAAYSEKLTVLIVEDSQSIQERLVLQLKDLKNIQHIMRATRFDEAVNLFHEHTPGLLIIDIGLSESRTGIDLLRLIRMENKEVKIIMLSNRANKFYRELCLSLGCDFFVDKSREFEKIPGIIAAIS